MRKRFVTALFICIIAVLGALSFTACKEDVSVAGKTFACSKVIVSNTEDDEEETETYTEAYKGHTITFNEDGTLKWIIPDENYDILNDATYTQTDKSLVIKSEDADDFDGEVDGETLVLRQTIEGIGLEFRFELKK